MREHEGGVPNDFMARIDSEIHHVDENATNAHREISKLNKLWREEHAELDERIRKVEIAVYGLGREMKIWGTILGALLVGVLTELIIKK